MYLTEAMIYLHANRLYHVLPLRYNRKFKKWEETFLYKPSAFESEIYPSHKSYDLYSVYFALLGAFRRQADMFVDRLPM